MSHLLILICILLGVSPVAAAPAVSRSEDVEKLVREEIAEACGDRGGAIKASAVIERDLTGDGAADLIVPHDSITCSDGGPSTLCGMQVCPVKIYVRRGGELSLVSDILGAGVKVGAGKIPSISMYAHGGKRGSIKWNGRQFR